MSVVVAALAAVLLALPFAVAALVGAFDPPADVAARRLATRHPLPRACIRRALARRAR